MSSEATLSFHRALVPKLALVLAGLFVGSVLAELTLHVLQLAPSRGVATVNESDFRALPGLFAPNQDLVNLRIRELRHHVRIDSLGYRGPNFPRRKQSGEVRFLAVGDSNTYGDFVDGDQTLPAYLEGALRNSCPGVRVINAGVGGTTIVTHRHMVERALALNPDLVVLVFSENDVTDLSGTPLWDQIAANRKAKSRWPLSVVYPVLHRMALWNLGLEVRGKLRAWARANAVEPQRPPDAPPERVGTGTTLEGLRSGYEVYLSDLGDRLGDSGIPLVFAVYPSHHSVAGTHAAEQVSWAVRVGRSAGLPTVNLLPALRRADSTARRLYLLPHDGHPSPEGHRVAAGVLADSLMAMDILGPLCEGN